jgi:hypothetical protein
MKPPRPEGSPRTKDMMDDVAGDPLYPVFEDLAGFIVEMNQKITDRVSTLSDDEVLRLAEACVKESQPGESPFDAGSSKNFEVPIWTEVSKTLKREVWLRRASRAAAQRMKETGESVVYLEDIDEN